MTLSYSGSQKFVGRERYIPLFLALAWLILLPAIGYSPLMNLGEGVGGWLILSSVGTVIPILALSLGFRTYFRIRRELGHRDRLLSASLAVHTVFLMLFLVILILIWPIILRRH
jgi:hypothetical protein